MPLTNLEVETLNAVKSAARKISNENIDWEERRYELVKEMMPSLLEHYKYYINAAADSALEYADIIIDKLRKTPIR